MFKINANQVQDIEAKALDDFLDEMDSWAVETHGLLVASQPAGAVRSEVLRARSLGFVLRGHAKRWLDLGFDMGMPFAEAGEAAKIAADTSMPPAVRLDVLEREALVVLLEQEEQEEEEVFRHAV
ncbi:MAG: hypothetical protein AAGH68_09575 [Pseudomonadota bacterium]